MAAPTLNDSPRHNLSPQHFYCNIGISYTKAPPTPYSEISKLLLTMVALSPRNFNYDTPYTTMLSTPYFDMWNLLFSTITVTRTQPQHTLLTTELHMTPTNDVDASNMQHVSGVRVPYDQS